MIFLCFFVINFWQLNFSNLIISWYKDNKRNLPWRETANPYLIWLSEIILQQTRVEQGLPYYIKFSSIYPSIEMMANETEEQILKHWQGLGYYSRARNMHATAKHVAFNLAGKFPSTFKEIKQLKGVGDYTAAAIASFSFNEKRAVVDGNVYRVLSRYFGIHTPIDSSTAKKEFSELANSLISKKQPGEFNQGIMEFGALMCKPKKPLCENCCFIESCHAFNKNEIQLLPIKSKKLKQRKRYFNFLVITDGETILMEQREKKDIWEKLYQFPLIETNQELDEIPKQSTINLNGYEIMDVRAYKHLLSHQVIYAKFWLLKANKINLSNNNFNHVKLNQLENFPVPKLVENYLDEFFQLIN